MKDSDSYFTIDLDTYEKLVADSNFLHALKAAGVDNWEGYSVAIALDEEASDKDSL